ncbi:MAG: SHOCT domain-containing protein [Candidatus Paceibacterota bacterium]
MNYSNFGTMGFGWVVSLIGTLWIILLIAAMIALIKYLMGEISDTNRKHRSPMEMVKERYAKGDIDKKEFDTLRKDLK